MLDEMQTGSTYYEQVDMQAKAVYHSLMKLKQAYRNPWCDQVGSVNDPISVC